MTPNKFNASTMSGRDVAEAFNKMNDEITELRNIVTFLTEAMSKIDGEVLERVRPRD